MEDNLDIREPVAGMSFFNVGGPREPFAWLQNLKQATGYFAYVEGYRQAVHVLIAEAGTRDRDNLYLDTTIFPLLFLVRHYVELRLKEILLIHGLTKEGTWEPREGHRLGALWHSCREIFHNRHGFSDDYLEVVGKPILELHRYDDNSEAFRYPYSRERAGSKKYAEVFPDHINYENILDVFERLHTALEGMYGDLLAEYEAIQGEGHHESDL